MVTHGYGWEKPDILAPVPRDKYRCLLSRISIVRLINPSHVPLPMGRPTTWTPEQLEFLRSFIPELPKARAGTGLNTLYQTIAQKFLIHWEPEPVTKHPAEPTATPERLKELTMIRHHSVRSVSAYVYSTIDRQHQRVQNWYKELLKTKNSKGSHPQDPYPKKRPLDLTGRSARKKPPYQLHQAFSVLYWRPMDSPLRREVDDLWAKRQEDTTRVLLNPFVKSGGGIESLSRLQFHMVVMQWKCSLLSPDELVTIRDWIGRQQALNDCPWAVEIDAYGDGLVAENRHIQRLVNCRVLRSKHY